jgi:hypothetical protein
MKTSVPAWPVNHPCPWLPRVERQLGLETVGLHRQAKGWDFHLAALACSQSLWMAGKPAQAILQINQSFMADLGNAGDENEFFGQPPPAYLALAWILREAAGGGAGFMGNPVRHFQHLATRMSGPRAEIRAWRAWACFHIAEKVLPAGHPRDGRQIAREGIRVPGWNAVIAAIHRGGWPGEGACAARAAASIDI